MKRDAQFFTSKLTTFIGLFHKKKKKKKRRVSPHLW